MKAVHTSGSIIAILGGSFDPPHRGHVGVINALLNHEGIAQVYVVPTGERLDKTASSGPTHRQKMVEILIEENFSTDKRVSLSTVQLDGTLPRGSFTIDLVRNFRAKAPSARFLFALGADMLPTIPKWKDADQLMKEVEFVVVPRPAFEINADPRVKLLRILLPESQLCSESSSEIRALIRRGDDPSGHLTPGVAAYIREQKLYR